MSADETLYPSLATRLDVILPGVVTSIEIGRERSAGAIDAALKDSGEFVLIPQLDPEVDEPTPDDLAKVGVLAEIAKADKQGPNRYTVVVRAIERVHITEFVDRDPYMVVRTSAFSDSGEEEANNTKAEEVREAIISVLSGEEDNDGAIESIQELTDAAEIVDTIIAHLDLERELRMELLTEADVSERARLILTPLKRMRDVLKLRTDLKGEFMDPQSREHRELVLRQRMKSIQEELGETSDENEISEMRDKVAESKMSDEARAASRKQLRRMSEMSPGTAEYNVAHSYVQWLLELPWGTFSEDTLDVPAARAILAADHAGLETVKKRILEFIAVRKLAPNKQGPIICLAGPPGVGKTSLGRSIASALGREYVRISLGGVRDDSEIRGHRRTYVGALPGRIVNGLKRAGTMNPVFVLDEIDKMASDTRGDPASAMLEVLDPEQNDEFVDHYIEVPMDLSNVMFLATANNLDTIPGPLRDRMEVINVPGYTELEKMQIARNYLVPRQKAEHGLNEEQIELDDEALTSLIDHYTREAGVRNLEREVASLCRSAAVTIASSKEPEKMRMKIDKAKVEEVLGPEKFDSEIANARPEIGVATGLAWTPVGGDLLFIEVRAMPGKGNRRLTGQLGDVMTESVQTAISYIRSRADEFGIAPEAFDRYDLHLHLPAGGIKKDGPSAGVAMAAAITSLLSNRPVRHDIACTGELTLRGRVLAVGGIKTKVLAAQRAGIKLVLLPERNRKDLEDIPESVLESMEIKFVSTAAEAFECLLTDPVTESDGYSAFLPPLPPVERSKENELHS
ncbi:MAG: endopeptidase La [Myxococcales bacterium]|nr:endopeptidase La [Myxococcales bacterium]